MTRARDLSPVRLRREEKGMLLIELARAVKRPDGRSLSAALISMIEGGYCPRVPTQDAIAEALEATREELFPQEFGGS